MTAMHFTRAVMPTFLLPSLGYWGSKRAVQDGPPLGCPSDGHVFAVNDVHQLTAIHPDNSVCPAYDGGPHPGYEAIEIDGLVCEIGWCEGQWDEYWCVVRHGCEIGHGRTRKVAIEAARRDPIDTPWLRGPKPDHSGKHA